MPDEHDPDAELQFPGDAAADEAVEWEDPLDALRRAYAQHLGVEAEAESPEPTHAPDEPEIAAEVTKTPLEAAAAAGVSLEQKPAVAVSEEDAAFELTPKSIIEAMLFVGHPDNEPLTSEQAASRMRGVSAEEVDDLIVVLNSEYEALGCPYSVVSQGSGYRLVLRDDYSWLRNKFYGKVREARLSQAAVDVLAIVAYRQPISREKLDVLRGKDSGGLLRQLVRRKLLRLEIPADKGAEKLFHTTERFLDLFGLESLDDLPQSEEIETTH